MTRALKTGTPHVVTRASARLISPERALDLQVLLGVAKKKLPPQKLFGTQYHTPGTYTNRPHYPQRIHRMGENYDFGRRETTRKTTYGKSRTGYGFGTRVTVRGAHKGDYSWLGRYKAELRAPPKTLHCKKVTIEPGPFYTPPLSLTSRTT